MSKATSRNPGLTNVSETWEQNEQRRTEINAGSQPDNTSEEVPAASELDRVIREEASEYDQESKEDRLLGGDRATLNDA